MLLQLFSPAVVCGRDPELQSLPCDGDIGIVPVDVWARHDVKRDRRRFFFSLVFWRNDGVRGRRFPWDGDQLHRVTLDRFRGRNRQLLRHDRDAIPSIG